MGLIVMLMMMARTGGLRLGFGLGPTLRTSGGA